MRERSLSFPGPFRADHVKEGSYTEVSNGHLVQCMPSGRRGGRSNLLGGEVLETDPAVISAGVDVGFSPKANELRAPDVSVGDFSNEPGWAPGAPPLAVEYADTGQDEAQLTAKIAELFAAGTKHVWVVRLVGPQRVEVHDKGKKMRLARPGDDLVAPGILKNPVPVLAMFDRTAAHEATLRNLLQRQGYESLDAVLAQGKAAGKAEGEASGQQGALLLLLRARGLAPPAELEARIRATTSLATLEDWIVRAATAASLDDVTAAPRAKPPAKGPPRAKR